MERVWEEILHAERWPTWWKYVVRVDELASGAEDGIGKRLRLVFRTLLPYTLGFDIRLTEVQPPSMLASVATGELEGTGRWLLTPEDGATLVRYNWDVRTTRWWMNLLAPIARPAFNWNHDQLMAEGGRSLARRLGVELELPSEERQPARAARWAVPAAAVVVLIALGWRRRASPR
jgi:hypothetical protein